MLHHLHPTIWADVKAASNDLARTGEKGLKTQIEYYLENETLIQARFRLAGQRGSDAFALIDGVRHVDPKAAIAAAFGREVTVFENLFEPTEAPAKPVAAASPMPEIDGMVLTEALARLADLSARLEAAKPEQTVRIDADGRRWIGPARQTPGIIHDTGTAPALEPGRMLPAADLMAISVPRGI